METVLLAGVARKDITPPVGTVLMGYVPRPSAAVHDKLTATALILRHGDEKIAVISITTTVIDDDETERIRHAVSDKTGIDPTRVMVCSCQIHSGPATQTCFGWGDRDEAYCREILEPAVCMAAGEASRNMAEVSASES